MQDKVMIRCGKCHREALLLKKPVYDGFKKIGDQTSCSRCGYVFNECEVPDDAPSEHRPNVFTDADRPKKPKVFDAGEGQTICRNCSNYVVNPFMQWCSAHKRQVDATESCTMFEKREEKQVKETQP